MRIGLNPHKDKPQEKSEFIHQIIIPVFIPNHKDYFKDSFKIFKLCLESLFATIHNRTYITIVNNGCDKMVIDYLDSLFKENKINELIHTTNIGKLNSILKGLSGNNIELVTIADSDVLFLSNWQLETNNVFNEFPKAGVVGIVPQFKTFTSKCDNIIFDNFFSKNLKFIPVKNPVALLSFYKSLGWDNNSNPDYLKLALGYVSKSNFKVYVGSGHFVATYKKDMFDKIQTYIGYKMGGDSESYLDAFPLNKDYWRLTTYDNFGYHMGNVFEQWMEEVVFENDKSIHFKNNFKTFENINKISFFIKNRLFRKLFKNKKVRKMFYRFKKLPKTMIQKY